MLFFTRAVTPAEIELSAGWTFSVSLQRRQQGVPAISYEDIIVESVESWIEITINRPEKLNALRNRTGEELLAALAEAEDDRAVGVVILKESANAFCTGVDTSEFKTAENEYFDSYRMRRHQFKVNELFRELPAYTKLVISAVEGFALGGGLELAMMGDIIVAGADAKLGCARDAPGDHARRRHPDPAAAGWAGLGTVAARTAPEQGDRE